MELTPGAVITLAVVGVLSFLLLRWGRRNEASPLMQAPRTPLARESMASRDAGGERQQLVEWLLERASEEVGVSVADDALARERIEEAAVKALEELQTSSSTTVSLPFLVADAQGPRHFTVEVKRNSDAGFELQR